MPDNSRLLARLTRTLASLPTREPLPTRLCQAYVDLAGGERGAISLGFSTVERSLLAATDEIAARYEEAQDLVREGPSLDAFRTGLAVWGTEHAAHGRRWPQLTSAVPDTLPRRVYAVPMRPAEKVIGVMTSHNLASADPPDREELQFLSDAVGVAIVGAVPDEEPERQLWGDLDRVAQATGMVVGQLGLGPADAGALLRAHAFAAAVPVLDVARRVLARELDFSADDDGIDAAGDAG